MAPNRNDGRGPGRGPQPAGGRGGGRGPHGGRGPNPNAPAAKKVHDNGAIAEKAPQQQPQQGGSAAAAEQPVKQGGWGSGISFKEKLMTPKAEPVPAPAPVAVKDSAAKPAANGPEVAKPGSPTPTPAAQSPAQRPYAAAVTSPVASGGGADSSDIQFGSFTEGEVAPGKEHAPPPANFGSGPGAPPPAPLGLPIPPGAGAGSGAPNAPVAAAAQAAINATNAAAPVSVAAPPPAAPAAATAAAPPAQPPAAQAPAASAAPAPSAAAAAPAAGGAAAAAGGSGGSGAAPLAPPASPGPSYATLAKAAAAATPPPRAERKVLKIVDPSSHQEVNLPGAAAGAGAAGEVKAAEGAAAPSKPAAAPVVHAPAPPPKRVLVIKEPSKKPEPSPAPKPAEAAKPAEPAVAAPAAEAAAPEPAPEAPAAPAEAPAAAAAPAKEEALAAAAPAAPAAPEAAAPAAAPQEASTSATEAAAVKEAEAPAAAPEPASTSVAVAEEAAAAGPASGAGSGDDSAGPSGAGGGGGGGKKKSLKQTLRDAEAKGSNSDMLSAFREPPPPSAAAEAAAEAPKEEPKAAPAAPAAPAADEPVEDWEERADEEPSASAPAAPADSRIVYTRDYLLSIGTRVLLPLPQALDQYHQSTIGLDKPQDNTRIGAGLALGRTGSRGEADWGRGREDRGMGGPGGPRGGDFRGGMGGDMRGPGGGMGGDRRGDRDGMRPGGPPGRGGPGGGMDRRGSANMDDGWQRRGPPPPPSPGGDMRGGRGGMSRQGSGASGGYGMGGGAVNLHKTESRWQVGVSVAEDPEEDKKQKTYKGILNKLTPDNYDKLKQQILAVPISQQRTLEGFINQIFDKALIETTFSEMYANLCKEIHPSLPNFSVTVLLEDPAGGPPKEVQRTVDFRRLLLNKCQQEFEDGNVAMKKVKDREAHVKEDAEKEAAAQQADKEGDKTPAPAPAAEGEGAKLEEGEIAASAASPSAASAAQDARSKAQAEAAEAERDLKARRRALGNIAFIGHLYKCGLLTEKIIHSCIMTLLADENTPRPEDIECLCKLLTTLGKQFEDAVNKKHVGSGQTPLDIFMARLARIRDRPTLDSRIKFAIQDVLELRAARWVSRRKVEGPKRIEDVHREAQQQLAAQASRDREERYGNRGPGGRGGPMGGRDAPPPPGPGGRYGGPGGGGGSDEARLMGRGEVARPLRGAAMERQASSEVSLRPSSFLTGKRAGSPAAPPGGLMAAAAASAREAVAAAQRAAASAAASAAAAAERPPPPPPAGMSEDAARKKGANWVKELYEVREKAAAAESLSSFKAEGAPMGALLAAAVREAFEVRGIEPARRLDLLKEVLVEQLSSPEGSLSSSMLEDAFGRFMGELHTWVEDNPKAAAVASRAIGSLAAAGHLGLAPCLRPLLDARGSGAGGEEEGEGADLPPLVEAGVAGQDILPNVLEAAVEAGGAGKAEELWRSSGLDAAKFFDMEEDVALLADKYPFVAASS